MTANVEVFLFFAQKLRIFLRQKLSDRSAVIVHTTRMDIMNVFDQACRPQWDAAASVDLDSSWQMTPLCVIYAT